VKCSGDGINDGVDGVTATESEEKTKLEERAVTEQEERLGNKQTELEIPEEKMKPEEDSGKTRTEPEKPEEDTKLEAKSGKLEAELEKPEVKITTEEKNGDEYAELEGMSGDVPPTKLEKLEERTEVEENAGEPQTEVEKASESDLRELEKRPNVMTELKRLQFLGAGPKTVMPDVANSGNGLNVSLSL